MRRHASALALALLLAGCGNGMTEVAHPFYLGSFGDNPDEIYLFRCLDRGGQSCAVDGLPGPGIDAAGANDRWIVVRQQGAGYIYFRRKPATERRGWGNDPETIVGPIDQSAFDAAQRQFGLPALSVYP